MYNFHPLAVNSIRLIRIEPELSHGHIACTLSQHDGQDPPYDALSYYWGNPTPTRKIYVNESVIDIHEALWEFLDQMQRSQQTGKWIWTDFLCLNQENIEEMGQQIPRMAHIYSEATRTISWLGCNRSSWVSCPDDLSTAPPDLEEDLRRIRDKVSVKRGPVESFFAQPQLLSWTCITRMMLSNYRPDASLPSEPSTPKPEDFPKPVKEVVQLGQGHMTSPILSILSLPYWTRVWIAQEVALARNVTLIFGGVSLEFQDFFLAYKSYFYFELKHGRASSTGKPALPVPIEARAAVNENHVSFSQIVRWGLDCNASNSVDRIYGLLGLLARCGDGSQPLPLTLNGTIDYRRDIKELFWDMAFTRPSPPGPFTAEDTSTMEGIEYWVDTLPTLGKVLDCPFTPESLQNEVDNSVPPLARDKAQLALSIVAICRQACIDGRTIWMKPADHDPDKPWLTKRHARRLILGPGETLINKVFRYKRFLGGLFLETSHSPGMDENDQYQAVCIGLRMSKLEPLGSIWNCGSHQSTSDEISTAPGHDIDVSFDCDFVTASSELPCSWTEQTFHRCRTQDRYLAIPGATWKLSLMNLSYECPTSEVYWKGTLNVKLAGGMMFHSS